VGHLRLSLVALASVKSAALVLELNLTVREARAPARSANAEAIGRMVEDEEPEFRAAVISDAELDRLIAHLGTNPLAEAEVRLFAEGVYVSLSQSQPAGLN
jgi:hypothetical protein